MNAPLTIPERMAAALAAKGPGDTAVGVLQHAGFTGREIAAHIDEAVARAVHANRHSTMDSCEPDANLLDAVQRARGLSRIGTLLASCELAASREPRKPAGPTRGETTARGDEETR